MKKELLFKILTLVACLLSTMGARAADYDFTYQNLKFAITSSTTAKVVGPVIDSPSGGWSIPPEANGYTINEIGNNAFENCSAITAITISPNITTVGASAFSGCSGLTRVNISNLEAWCRITFQGTANANPLYYARHLYLNNSEVTQLNIPDGITQLGSFTFFRCEGLTSVTIPASVTSIGWSCFANCANLTSITCSATTPPTLANQAVFSNTTYSGVPLNVPRNCKSAYQSATYWSEFTTINELAYDFTKNGIYYNITGSNTVEVTYKDTNYNTYSGNVSIPSSVTYNGTTYQVTSIGSYAFRDCTDLTSITIPSTVTRMESYAFGSCSGLTRVNISNLSDWFNITMVNAWSSPLYYAKHLYVNGTEVTQLTIPDGISVIKDLLFYNCQGLTSVTIPAGVTSIGWSCFNSCTNLTSVTCQGSTPPTIANQAVFDDATYNSVPLTVLKGYKSAYQAASYWNLFTTINETHYDFVMNGIYYNITGDNTVEVTYRDTNYNSYSGSVIIPSNVTYNSTIYQVTSISENAFNMSSDLTSVTIPSTVTEIGSRAFDFCSGLTRVNISNLRAWLTIRFAGSAMSNPLYYARHLYLNGSEVTDLIIPEGIQTLGDFLFFRCEGLRNVTIPADVTSIGWSCFNGCINLTSVTCLATTPPTLDNAGVFSDEIYNNVPLTVPKGCTSAYQSATYWSQFANIVEAHYDFMVNGIYYNITGDNTVEVTYRDTNFNTYSGAVLIPSNVTYDGTAYRVTGIGESAFSDCRDLTSVTIPSSVTTMGIHAFVRCTGLTRVNIYSLAAWCKINFRSNADSNPLTFAKHLYVYGSEVTDLTIPDDIQELGAFVFYNCLGLRTVTIPASVTSIGWSCFSGCTNITKVTCYAPFPPTTENEELFSQETYSSAPLYVPLTCKNIYQSTDYWSKFTNIIELPYSFVVDGIYYTISGPNAVKVVNNGMFDCYTGNVAIPATVHHNEITFNVKSIDSGAFSNSVNLTNVIIPNSVTTIGAYAFSFCHSLKQITIPSSVTTIGTGALGWCDSLRSVTCLATTPPTAVVNDTTDLILFGNAMLFVPKASINAYKAANYWKRFSIVHPHLEYALNVPDGTIEFATSSNYPWTNVVDGDRIYAQSGNMAAHSTQSILTATVDVPAGGTLSFDFKAFGEGQSWDVCVFIVDGVQRFSYGERDNDWENYTVDLSPGTHSLLWRYNKDSSVNPVGDFFALDNVTLTANGLRMGDVNGDNSVDIDDVTLLISSILGNTSLEPSQLAAANINGDNSVDIDDVTALIAMILGN